MLLSRNRPSLRVSRVAAKRSPQPSSFTEAVFRNYLIYIKLTRENSGQKKPSVRTPRVL